tara:strand:- start:85 stop:315 length:231 start_codon:yes stop_codon:yes gene_type:complete
MNKITQKELELLQEQDQEAKTILHNIGLYQTEIHKLSHLFAKLNEEIEVNKKVLEDKYGLINIDLSNGNINSIENE